MKHVKSLFTFIVLLISIVSTGANHNFNIEPFRLNHRLPTGYIYRIFNDSKGFVWFGTSEGVSRYDGYDIKTFRSSALNPDILSSNHIRCFAEDARGRIWIAYAVGYSDPKYFSRCFKQTFGITPREYLQKRNDRQSL